jgi:osmotically-inducible protein OsmY
VCSSFWLRISCTSLLVLLCACTAQQQQSAQQNTQVLASAAPSFAKSAYLVTAVGTKLAAIDVDATTSVHIAATSAGVVTLSGEAHSAAERVQYVTAAKSVPGVIGVLDRLRVNPNLRGVRGTVSDAALTASVSAAIAGQAGTNVFRVTPSVHDGVVTLHGTAPTPAIHETIVSAVRHVRGVRRVVDRITVR